MNEVTELRAAVKILRCDHRFPAPPPHGSLAHPDTCSRCGVPQDTELTPEDLADLLEAIAYQYEGFPVPDVPIVHAAVEVARGLSGTTEGVTTS